MTINILLSNLREEFLHLCAVDGCGCGNYYCTFLFRNPGENTVLITITPLSTYVVYSFLYQWTSFNIFFVTVYAHCHGYGTWSFWLIFSF